MALQLVEFPQGSLGMDGRRIGKIVEQVNDALTEINASDSYTPTIVGTTIAGTGTYTTQVGRVTVIGNVCFFSANLTWTAHTGTGNMQLSLPYTSLTLTGYQSPLAVWNSNITLTAASLIQVYVASGATTARIEEYASGGGASAAVAIDAAASLSVSGFYHIA